MVVLALFVVWMDDHMADGVVDGPRGTESGVGTIRIATRIVLAHAHGRPAKVREEKVDLMPDMIWMHCTQWPTYSRWPSALAKAQWAAVRMTRRAITAPAHG